MVLVVREFVRTRDPLIHDPLNTYTPDKSTVYIFVYIRSNSNSSPWCNEMAYAMQPPLFIMNSWLQLSGLFIYQNTFILVWEQRGSDNRGSTVYIFVYIRSNSNSSPWCNEMTDAIQPYNSNLLMFVARH